MWRRLASLSSSISSSFLAQTASKLNTWESLTTGIAQQAKGVIAPKEKTPFITFVLEENKIKDANCTSSILDSLPNQRNGNGDVKNYILYKCLDRFLHPTFTWKPFVTPGIDTSFPPAFQFSGGPGSGKGTQCIKIVETFGFAHLSAGDLLRREIASKSADGAMILKTIKEGKIVPSQVTVKLIQKEMELSDNHKFLIDGFPRTEENRVSFERIIGVEPNVVLFFDCPEEEMVKRVLNRNEALSLPVINYYSERGKLYTIKAIGTEDEIFEQVRPIFAAFERTVG
ncbi:putative UMP-CMP kinase 2 isoform X3 [Gossypium australe]|uniref:adenylate kinase n=1 Tax=Gossypium australe TaxID=47621 RepID=A0A5B6USH1_9ROSI|nr:putative UMP-CMP kinase 2 isoform X3 [Gossypium australe]